MRQFVRLLIPAALLLAGGVSASNGQSRAGETDSGSAAVLFAPGRPVFLRWRVQVDGKTVGAKPGESKSSETKAGETKPGKTQARSDRSPLPLIIVTRKETGGEADQSLFQHLDLNGDGVLTAEELHKARETLAPLDADDDETISVAELASAVSKRAVSATPLAALAAKPANKKADKTKPADRAPIARLPLLIISPEASAQSVAEALLRDYSSRSSDGAKSRLDPAALGLSLAEIQPFDHDGDGKLDAGELAKLAGEIAPQLEISFQLFDQRRGRSRVSLVAGSRTAGYEWQQSAGDAATLVVNGLKVGLAAKRTRASTGDMSSFYALRFHIVDTDKNNYLDRKEFAALGLPAADFAAVDANHDGQIVAGELSDYFKREIAGVTKRVVVTVADESKTLFEFLDTRPDGRLSPRELNVAADRLAELDRNQDGKLTQTELRTQMEIEVEVKRYPETRAAMAIPRPRNQSAAAVARDRGPEWFLRMDRNYDGDVSWREFLGSRQAFDQLDADRDGLLSPEEAERAK